MRKDEKVNDQLFYVDHVLPLILLLIFQPMTIFNHTRPYIPFHGTGVGDRDRVRGRSGAVCLHRGEQVHGVRRHGGCFFFLS